MPRGPVLMFAFASTNSPSPAQATATFDRLASISASLQIRCRENALLGHLHLKREAESLLRVSTTTISLTEASPRLPKYTASLEHSRLCRPPLLKENCRFPFAFAMLPLRPAPALATSLPYSPDTVAPIEMHNLSQKQATTSSPRQLPCCESQCQACW